jgi:hypothetical protein
MKMNDLISLLLLGCIVFLGYKLLSSKQGTNTVGMAVRDVRTGQGVGEVVGATFASLLTPPMDGGS